MSEHAGAWFTQPEFLKRRGRNSKCPPVCVAVPPFSLDPLRELGPDALIATGVPGIVRIVLCEIKIICGNGHCCAHTVQSDDLFDAPHTRAHPHPVIPRAGRLTRATLRIQFADSSFPRPVILSPPQALQLLRKSDAEPVKRWLALRRFQLPR